MNSGITANAELLARAKALGLSASETQKIIELLGRLPTTAEVAIYSVMWSEHCSYKSSRKWLRIFGDTMTAKMRERLLVGMGANAGVLDIGEGWAVTFKVESHNHPSFVEPHQGAATGVGGIVRDIIAMGARPIAVMDSLRFGDAEHPDTKRVAVGVVGGISAYANSLGLPNIGGETWFDSSYQENPLVNVLAVGKLRHEQLREAKATGVGNRVVLFGATTGGDGIGGASVLASDVFDPDAETKRPAVQVGDPFTEKCVLEACLELYADDLVAGIGDLGAAGISCATAELAATGDGGMRVELDRVPLRDASLTPEEILMSESQERMLAIVEPGKLAAVMQILDKWGLAAADIGEVTAERRLMISWHGEVIVDLDPSTVADGPVYDRPLAEPSSHKALAADSAQKLPRSGDGAELKQQLLQILGSQNQASTAWITSQYDRFVLGNTALAAPDDAGMLRIDEDSQLGVSVAIDGNHRYSMLDPRVGVQAALAEAYRNVAVTGAVPLGVTDCLNFGSPEDPAVMWAFAEAVQGLAAACAELEIPVTGGNVSFYNQTGDKAIVPSPVIGVIGVIDNVARRVPSGWQDDGHNIYLLGESKAELDGSIWAETVHGHLGGKPPAVELQNERTLAEIMHAASFEGLIDSAHDLSDGGLAVALVESVSRFGVGARVYLNELAADTDLDTTTLLFAESQARVIVTVPREEDVKVRGLCTGRGYPLWRIGVTDAASAALEMQGLFTATVDELRSAGNTLNQLFAPTS